MALLGKAAIAMWWDMAESMRTEFEDWHSHEHVVERLGIAGFLRASRWRTAQREGGYFVTYELADHDVASSDEYLQRLNAPTPWSTKMMPHHAGMMRGQCRVLESAGGYTAGHAATVRLSPRAGEADRLRQALRAVAADLAERPGLVGAHLLRNERPAIGPTMEQKIRGADAEPDWVFIVAGYDPLAVRRTMDGELSETALHLAGAASGAAAEQYMLSFAAMPGDVR